MIKDITDHQLLTPCETSLIRAKQSGICFLSGVPMPPVSSAGHSPATAALPHPQPGPWTGICYLQDSPSTFFRDSQCFPQAHSSFL